MSQKCATCQDIDELAKNYKTYKNQSEVKIFRKFDSGNNELIANSATIQIVLLKTNFF